MINGLTLYQHANNYVAGFFHTSRPELKDGVLSPAELDRICAEAEAALSEVFPNVKDITVAPVSQGDDDFAGYVLTFDGKTDGPFVFTFPNVDVVG